MKQDELTPPAPRESEVVLRLAAFRYLAGPQLAEFVFDGTRVRPRSRKIITWRLLAALRARGLIASTPRLVGGPGGGSARLSYYLTPAGYRLARLLSAAVPPQRRRSPGTFLIRHALLTAEIALAFRQAASTHPGHELVAWECDWQAALSLGSSPVAPDAYLLYAVGSRRLHAFVEVDLGTEHTGFFARKIRRYLALERSASWRSRLPVWPLVLVVAESAARATLLRRATEAVLAAQPDAGRLGQATAFAFAAVGDVLGASGPLGEIWEFAGRPGRVDLSPEPARAELEKASGDLATPTEPA